MTARPYRGEAGGLRLAVRVAPRASRARFIGIAHEPDGGCAAKIAVTAPPEDGKANAALVALLAGALGIAKRDIEILRGASDRRKTLLLRGDVAELAHKLDRWMEMAAA